MFMRALGFLCVVVWALLGLTWLWAPIYLERNQAVQETTLNLASRLQGESPGTASVSQRAERGDGALAVATGAVVTGRLASFQAVMAESTRDGELVEALDRDQEGGVAAMALGPAVDGAAPLVETAKLDQRTRQESIKRAPIEATEERVIQRGDTLVELLRQETLSYGEAIAVIDALKQQYDPRRLQIGQKLWLTFIRTGDSQRLKRLELVPAVGRRIEVVSAGAGRYQASESVQTVERSVAAAQGVITSSLFEAGERAGVPLEILVNLLKVYAYDVDFQRDIQPGDAFEVLYERFMTDSGELARVGEIQYAALVLGGRERPVFRFERRDGTAAYYDESGRSTRKALLRTPVDGARISSGFGVRRHPVLGYSKMHKGVDFAAPTGTPIFAAGDGVVLEIGRKGSYGNYIRLRHNSRVSTAYAHLSRYARGLRRGDRVDQGEVIGFVGSTGRSTGPHLHFEVLKDGRQINPMSLKPMSADHLVAAELRAFRRTADELRTRFAELMKPVQVAQVVDSTEGEAAD